MKNRIYDFPNHSDASAAKAAAQAQGYPALGANASDDPGTVTVLLADENLVAALDALMQSYGGVVR